MHKLNLDDFKAKMSAADLEKTQDLIGGILGDCHYPLKGKVIGNPQTGAGSSY